MSEKEKKTTVPDKSDAKPESKQKTDKASVVKPKKMEPTKDNTPAPVAPAVSTKPRHRRGGLLGRRSKPVVYPVDILARRTDTDPVVLGALKAAYGWSDRSTLTQAEFIGLRDAWLKRPVKEG